MGGHGGRFGFLWNVLVEGGPRQDQETGVRGVEAVPNQLEPEILEAHPAAGRSVSEEEGGYRLLMSIASIRTQGLEISGGFHDLR